MYEAWCNHEMYQHFYRAPSKAHKKSEIVKVPLASFFPYRPRLWRIVESTMYWVKQIFNLLHVQGKSDFRPTYGLQLRAGDMASGWLGVNDVCGHCWRLWLDQTDTVSPTFPRAVGSLSSALFQNPSQTRALWGRSSMVNVDLEFEFLLDWLSSFRAGTMIHWFGVPHVLHHGKHLIRVWWITEII